LSATIGIFIKVSRCSNPTECLILVLYSVSGIDTLYIVISTFRHRGIEKFFRTGSKAGIQAKHAAKLRLQLFALDNARTPRDMNAPGWKLHPLGGELKDHWAL